MYMTQRPKIMLLMVAVLASMLTPLSQVVRAAPIQESPDSSFDTPLIMPAIGSEEPVVATIGVPGDVDGFQFTAVAGRTYAIELFNVNASLGQGTQLYYCNGFNGYYRGMGLAAFDVSTNSQLILQCQPNGTGNVLTSITIKAASSGAYKLKVYAHVATSIGAYSLRVLPKYEEDGATWDPQSFEPNNAEANAYLLVTGREHAITSTIEQRDSIYATNSGDKDWYRFSAVTGQTYTIEVFNVSASLGQGTQLYYCNGFNGYYRGLALFVYDAVTNSTVTQQCQPNGSNNILSTMSFKASSTGTYTLLIYPHVPTTTGTYSVRVLPKYGEAGASWDTQNYEPNNSEPNAYPITTEQAQGFSSTIEPRDSIYATNSGDNDWYVFQARRGEPYTVEVSDVGGSIGQSTNLYYCDGLNNYYHGLGIAAYNATTGVKLASRCQPNGSGSIHTSIQFQAVSNGSITVRIFPHVGSEFGQYVLRIQGRLGGVPSPTAWVYLPLTRR